MFIAHSNDIEKGGASRQTQLLGKVEEAIRTQARKTYRHLTFIHLEKCAIKSVSPKKAPSTKGVVTTRGQTNTNSKRNARSLARLLEYDPPSKRPEKNPKDCRKQSREKKRREIVSSLDKLLQRPKEAASTAAIRVLTLLSLSLSVAFSLLLPRSTAPTTAVFALHDAIPSPAFFRSSRRPATAMLTFVAALLIRDPPLAPIFFPVARSADELVQRGRVPSSLMMSPFSVSALALALPLAIMVLASSAMMVVLPAL